MLLAEVELRATGHDHGARAARLWFELGQLHELLFEVHCLQHSATQYASYLGFIDIRASLTSHAR